MKLPSFLGLGLAVLIASCTPYPDTPPIPPTPPAQPGQPNVTAPDGVTPPDAGADGAAGNRSADTADRQDVEEKIPERRVDPDPEPPAANPGVQVAKPVPGKPGFVFSPFNNKIIDVKGIPSGTLVADPTYPRSEKKYFRVP